MPDDVTKKPKLTKAEVLPPVVNNGSDITRLYYHAVQQEYERIADSIRLNDRIKSTELEIVPSKIAKITGFDPSIIDPNYEPEMYDYVKQLNAKLHSLEDKRLKDMGDRLISNHQWHEKMKRRVVAEMHKGSDTVH